ncbi:MAG: adenosine deaminase [Gammaproteobacteria bacterium]|nr:adenosine deaminase [Gammaproteobacteria bacterium]
MADRITARGAGLMLLLGLVLAAPLQAHAGAADPGAVADFIMGLPKTELHIHLEGTLEAEDYLALMARNGRDSPYGDAAAVRDRLTYARDLDTFIEVYEELLGAMETAHDFEQVAMTYIERVSAQGVIYVEMFFDPQMHTYRGVALETVMEGLYRAHARAPVEYGVELWFIACFNRDRSAASALRHLEALAPYQDIVIGVGLDNPEEIGFPEKFATVFARAAAMGFRRTTHLDVDVPNTIEHHWSALRLLDIERIDHGLNVADDPGLIVAVREAGIALTACPTLLYRDIPGRLEGRLARIRTLLDAGIEISLHSDDPGLMRDLYVGDLYLLAHLEGGFTRAEIVALARNSLLSAWVDEDRRRIWLQAFDAWLQAHPVAF